MIAFDDTGMLWPHPYSLWERVHGETLGVLARPATQLKETWRAVGRELAFLHTRVCDCHDPLGYLDAPERDLGLEAQIEDLQRKGLIERGKATAAALLLAELRPLLGVGKERCFLHNDLHDMNLMCTSEDTFLALIDWGDAGWGDSSLDFAKVPIDAMEYVLQGYGKNSPALRESNVRGKMLWDKIGALLQDMAEGLQAELSLSGFREFLDA
jgi:aminoglycoside phosphotransferase (APT) family kinase protein